MSYDMFMPRPPPCLFGLMPTSSKKIIQVSGLLKTRASAGIDDINPSIALSTIAIIATPLIEGHQYTADLAHNWQNGEHHALT